MTGPAFQGEPSDLTGQARGIFRLALPASKSPRCCRGVILQRSIGSQADGAIGVRWMIALAVSCRPVDETPLTAA